MKKAILIAKFNEITKEISSHLATKCNVQLCADNREIMIGMLQMTKPDMVIVLMTGIVMMPTDVMTIVVRECPLTPTLIVGNADDESLLRSKRLLEPAWVRFVRRPVKTDKICELAEQMMSEDFLKKAEPAKSSALSEEDENGEKLPSVLLVDDSPTLLRSMQGILSRRYRVSFATSGFQAISSISKNRPDIILLDYEMPVCDGKMTLQMLRAEDSTKNIPVIFLTGMAESARVIEALEYQPEGYLLKPCSEKKLFATIEKVLEQHAQKEKETKEA